MTRCPILNPDLAATDSRLRRLQTSWAEGLTVAQVNALESYKGQDGRAINLILRRNIAVGPLARAAAHLREAPATAQAPEAMVTWRGMGPAEALIYRTLGAGGMASLASFFSTTLDRREAERAAADQVGGALAHISIRKGTAGIAYIHPFPRYRYPQYEVLANVGARLRVVESTGDVIRLEIVNDSTDK